LELAQGKEKYAKTEIRADGHAGSETETLADTPRLAPDEHGSVTGRALVAAC